MWVGFSGESEHSVCQVQQPQAGRAYAVAGPGVAAGASLASGTEGLAALECDVEVLLLALQQLALRCMYSALVTRGVSEQGEQGGVGRLDSQGVVVDMILEALNHYTGGTFIDVRQILLFILYFRLHLVGGEESLDGVRLVPTPCLQQMSMQVCGRIRSVRSKFFL